MNIPIQLNYREKLRSNVPTLYVDSFISQDKLFRYTCQEYEAQLAALKKQKEDQAPNPINGKMFLEPEVY